MGMKSYLPQVLSAFGFSAERVLSLEKLLCWCGVVGRRICKHHLHVYVRVEPDDGFRPRRVDGYDPVEVMTFFLYKRLLLGLETECHLQKEMVFKLGSP